MSKFVFNFTSNHFTYQIAFKSYDLTIDTILKSKHHSLYRSG